MDYKNIIISLLLEQRDYLCWQMTFESGGITEDQFNLIFDKYWQSKNFSDQDMIEMFRILIQINPELKDGELASSLFRISLNKAFELKSKLYDE